ncbi:MAG: LCP family protein [Treponemataceae bacterium]|nr:LCP family protein [Treponemataceae bacterium]
MRIKREHKGMIFLVLIAIIVVAMILSVYLYMRADSIHDSLKVDPVIKSLILVEEQGDLFFAGVFLCYPESGRGALVTIPENTGGIYNSLGRIDRIDSVYKEKGLEAFKNEVEKLIDMKINFTMKISIDDFQKLSDLLGGLTVFIPSPIDERGADGQIWLLPSGSVRLLGGKVRVYMTYRLEDEDDSSVRERRKAMVVALLSALRENKSVIMRKDNFDEFSSCFSTNLSKKYFVEFFDIITTIGYEQITLLEVTGLNQNVDGKILLYPFRNGDFIKEVVRRAATSIISSTDMSNDRTYSIEIQNGTLVRGLAHNTQILLQGAGFDVINATNAPRDDYGETEIIDLIGNPDAAKAIGDFIRCTKITEMSVAQDDKDVDVPNYDFILILGSDFDGRWVHGQQ